MIHGDINTIDLGTSLFEQLISGGNLYVDKTRMIEHFLTATSRVHLVARQRRLGKSLNMDMLRCFLTDRVDNRGLFAGLYIETSPVWGMANSAPVFCFDFKGLRQDTYREQVIKQVDKHINSVIAAENLQGYLKRQYDLIIDNPKMAVDSLQFLTELAYEITGKRSYLLIDEYDKLLMESFNTDKYEEIRSFETALLSSGLKGNPYLEKALLTGVMRISHESLLSGLNNIVTFDVFKDNLYTDDYGLTDEEVDALSQMADFNTNELKSWYNGVKIGGQAIYNTYSVMSFIYEKQYDCFWGKSGTLEMIINLLNDQRKLTLARLLNGEQVEVEMDTRISLKHLESQAGDEAFYSLLVQAGYLALDERKLIGTGLVSIPNQELMIVWKNFIISRFYSNPTQVRTLFENADNLKVFAKDVEHFLNDRLSYHDLAVYKGEDKERAHERAYHIYLLGILSAYEDVHCRYPLSNRESGDGRYDILVEKPEANYVFELKSCEKDDDLTKNADAALAQINSKRYGLDTNNNKRLIKTGIAFHNKTCRVACG